MEKRAFVETVCHNVVEPVYIVLVELVFVLFYDGAKPMAVVMKHYPSNGYASQDVAFRAVQHLVDHTFAGRTVSVAIHFSYL